MSKNYTKHPQSLSECFSLMVDKTGDCWIWQGKIGKNGYGYIDDDGNGYRIYAHRASYLIHTGSHPGRLKVMHSCDNPRCVRPEHLSLGTQLENIADMWAKGRGKLPPRFTGDDHWTKRHPELVRRGAESWSSQNPQRTARGEGHGMSRLTELAVKSIRARYCPQKVSMKELAQEFGVSLSTINRIVKGHIWKHVS